MAPRPDGQRHERAFRRLGGAPRVIVVDNLREGVIEPEIYDPVLNPLFRDLLRHYGAIALPARVGHPDRKGKGEAGVGHAQNTPLKGPRFDTLEEAYEVTRHLPGRRRQAAGEPVTDACLLVAPELVAAPSRDLAR